MTDPLDLHVHTYAVARLAGVAENDTVAIALRAILSRSFPPSEPPPVKERRLTRTQARRAAGASTATASISIKPVASKDFGYSEKAHALWIIKDALPDFRDMPRVWKSRETAKMMFDRGHDLYDNLRAFARDEKALQAWREGRLNLSAILGDTDKHFLRGLLAIDTRLESISYHGMPIIGSNRGVVWIGLTDDPAVFEELEAAKRAGVIQRIEDRPLAADRRQSLTIREGGPLTDRDGQGSAAANAERTWHERLALLRAGEHEASALLLTIGCCEIVGVPATHAIVRRFLARHRSDGNSFQDDVDRLLRAGWISSQHHEGDRWQVDDPDERLLLALNPAAKAAIHSELQNNTPLGSAAHELFAYEPLYPFITWVTEQASVAPAIRVLVLRHPLAPFAFAYEEAEHRRLELLLALLPPGDTQRVESAIALAPTNPEAAAAAIAEYVAEHPDADEHWACSLDECAKRQAWEAFTTIWPEAVTVARKYTKEVMAHLSSTETFAWSPFPKMFWEATRSAFLIRGKLEALIELFARSFEGNHQAWTLWIGTATHPWGIDLTEQFTKVVNPATLSPDLRLYYDHLLTGIAEIYQAMKETSKGEMGSL
jgi:hypothetical protein